MKIDSDSEDSKDHYHLAIDFFKEIDTENSRQVRVGNAIKFVLRKKEKQEEYWPRITKEKVKYHYIKTDFDKWVDEDEQEEAKDEDDMLNGMGGMPGMDMASMMGGMGGMEGMPGMGGAGGMGGGDAPGMPPFDLEAMARENPQLNKLRDENGEFDFSKLTAGLGGEEAGLNSSVATEGDFSSSDDEDDTKNVE